MSIRYFAYSTKSDNLHFSFEGRDDAIGVLGTIAPTADPIAEADDLQILETRVLAYLCLEPENFVYIADSGNRVHKILINKKYHDAIERANTKLVVAVALLIFSLTSLFADMANVPHLWNFAFLSCAVLIYVSLMKIDFLNEIEGAVCCEVLLILASILAPVFQHALLVRLHSS